MAQETRHPFWQTLPGMLTAVAGIIAAGTGLLTALYQTGVIGNRAQTPSSATNSAPTATSPAPTSAAPSATATPAASGSVANAPAAGTTSVHTADTGAFEDRPVNLLASENGGHLVATSSDEWQGTIDGKEVFNQISYGLAQQNFAVFGFEEEKPARFDLFTLLVPATQDTNVKEFELLVGNDSPTGRFSSIGTFTTQNLKLMRTPFQEFRFPAVTAKYLKVRLVTSYGYTHPDVREIRLFGVRAR